MDLWVLPNQEVSCIIGNQEVNCIIGTLSSSWIQHVTGWRLHMICSHSGMLIICVWWCPGQLPVCLDLLVGTETKVSRRLGLMGGSFPDQNTIGVTTFLTANSQACDFFHRWWASSAPETMHQLIHAVTCTKFVCPYDMFHNDPV